MRKEIRPKKLKDMIRSILPSKNREAARLAKALTNREHRRGIRVELRHEDAEETAADLMRCVSQANNVSWRRGGDKLNHFMRWCEAITEGMTTEEAISYVRSILPSSLIGDHAFGHWENHRRDLTSKRRYPGYMEVGGRRVQSFIDSTTFRLRRALTVDPTLHARVNEEIKRRKPLDQPRRMLAGVHDIEDFVYAIARPVHVEAYYRRSQSCPFDVERATTLELIERVEKMKGGRKAALRVWLGGDSAHEPPTTRYSTWAAFNSANRSLKSWFANTRPFDGSFRELPDRLETFLSSPRQWNRILLGRLPAPDHPRGRN